MKHTSTTTGMFKLQDLRKIYSQATKNERRRLLDEFCYNFGYNRKYAIRLLKSNSLNINKTIACKKRGPKPSY